MLRSIGLSFALGASLLAAPAAVGTKDGGTLVPGITGWLKLEGGGERLAVIMDSRACFFQSITSPSEMGSLKGHAPERVVKDIDGPAGLLTACQAMKAKLGDHSCSKVFLGGHNDIDGVGVKDLFYTWPNGTPQDKFSEYLATGGDAVGSREAALKSLAGSRYCMLGPVGTTAGGKFTPANPPRVPTADEQRTLFAVVDCLRDLSEKSPTASVVFSSCGPLSPPDYPVPSSGTGVGQGLCAQLLADALSVRVVYNRGICMSADQPGAYDTSAYGEGHAAATPSYPSSSLNAR